MSTQQAAIDLMLSTFSPFELAIFDRPQEVSPPSWAKSPGDFHSRQAQELAKLGETEKAERLDNCQTLVRAVLCKKGGHLKHYHRWRCMERFCDHCAKQWAITQRDKCGRLLARLVERTPEREMQLYHLSVTLPCPMIEPKRVKELLDSFGASIRKLAKKRKFGAQEGMVGFKNGCLTMQVVVHLGGPALAEEQFRSVWPEAQVKVSPIGKQHFLTILKQIFTTHLPQTHADRARLEVACARLHLGRTLGTFYTEAANASKEVAEANTAQTEEHCCMGGDAYTTKFAGPAESHDPNTRQSRGSPCPKCGDTEEETTGWMRWDELREFLADRRHEHSRHGSHPQFAHTAPKLGH